MRHRIDGFQTVQTSLVLALPPISLSLSIYLSILFSLSFYLSPFLYHPHTRRRRRTQTKLFDTILLVVVKELKKKNLVVRTDKSFVFFIFVWRIHFEHKKIHISLFFKACVDLCVYVHMCGKKKCAALLILTQQLLHHTTT